MIIIIIIIIIEGLSLLQSIPPTTANKQTQAQKKGGSMARKLLYDNIFILLTCHMIILLISYDNTSIVTYGTTHSNTHPRTPHGGTIQQQCGTTHPNTHPHTQHSGTIEQQCGTYYLTRWNNSFEASVQEPSGAKLLMVLDFFIGRTSDYSDYSPPPGLRRHARPPPHLWLFIII